MEIKNKKRGVSLIALIIVIIIILIITSAIIVTDIGSDGGIFEATTAKFKNEYSQIKDIINAYIISKTVDPDVDKDKYEFLSVNELNDILNIKKYEDKLGICNNKIVLLSSENAKEEEYAKNMDYEIMNLTPDEFNYYIELLRIEKIVEKKKFRNYGRALSATNIVKVGNIEYGKNWYLIGNYTTEEKNNGTYNKDYETMGIYDTTHAPYLVNYTTGEVVSIDGMVMYKTETLVHSFSHIKDLSQIQDALVYVDTDTNNTAEHYGNLYSTLLYTGDVMTNQGADYSDNNGELVYDKDGALLLDQNNNIPVLSVNQKYDVYESIGLSITFKGEFNQPSSGKYPISIVALSDVSGKYLAWIGLYNKYLRIYTWTNNVHASLNNELTAVGFLSADISKYSNKTMNIQISATKGKTTKVYINGELFKSFKSGTLDCTYRYLTIGDLRVGRNLKFTGKIYDFAFYDTELTEEEVKNNYSKSQKYITLN